MTDKAEPINLVGDRMRFLCEYENGQYSLHMGNGMYRHFDDTTLPAELKTLIGLINGFDWDSLHKTHGYNYIDHIRGVAYDITWSNRSYYPEVCNEIGWRVADCYALTVPYKYFMELKGDES